LELPLFFSGFLSLALALTTLLFFPVVQGATLSVQ
jgi:hypothetical protein